MPRYPTERATSAGGVVCDDREDGKRWVLLIALRNAAGKPQWTLPKGGIEGDESPERAALREVREETGYGADVVHRLGTIDYWFVWRPDKVRYHKYVHYFFMRYDGRPPGERDDEAEHVEWVPIDAALVRLAHRNERNLVRQAMPSEDQQWGRDRDATGERAAAADR
ncbi:MAG TPA: NUDIX domain-containing protein [Nitriliruptorales bacterium]